MSSLLGSFEDELHSGDWSTDATESPFDFVERFTTTEQEQEEQHHEEDVPERNTTDPSPDVSRQNSVASLNDHNVIVGFEPGTLVELFRSSDNNDNDDNNSQHDNINDDDQEQHSQQYKKDDSSYGSEVDDVGSFGSNTILPSRDSSTRPESVQAHTQEMTVLLDDMITATEGVCRNLNRLLDGESLQGSEVEQSLLSSITQEKEEGKGKESRRNEHEAEEPSSSSSVGSSSSRPLSMVVNSSLWDDDSSILSLHSTDDAISRLQQELQQHQQQPQRVTSSSSSRSCNNDANESVSASSVRSTASQDDDFEIIADHGDLGLAAVIHDRDAFMNVANRLSSVPEDKECNRWYSKFGEYEWEQFRLAAKQVLDVVDPSSSSSMASRLPLPPIAPNDGRFIPQHMYAASEVLPDAFVCPICKDAVVGATTLSCGCPSSTVCTACWEIHTTIASPSSTSTSTNGGSQGDNTVAGGGAPTDCPCCYASVTTAIPCHAVDVAILRAVQHATAADTTSSSSIINSDMVESLQLSYYYRLDQWRKEILKRRSEENGAVREKILSQMIQNEEELLWNDEQRRKQRSDASTTTATPFWKTRGFSAVSELAILLLATSLGVGMVARRRKF